MIILSDIKSRRVFVDIVLESMDKRDLEIEARRDASQPEPDNPLMCDLLSMMNHVIKRVGAIGAEIRKNKGDSSW